MTSVTRLLVMFLLLVGTETAHADDPLAKPTNAEAQTHLTSGNRLYRLRELDKAIAEYKAGALKEDAPVFLYNLAQCYRQLGRYDDAIWHYERFIDRAKPTGTMRETIDGFITQMKDELAKKATTQPPVEPGPDPKPSPPHVITIVDGGEPWYSDGLGWGLTGVGAIGVGISVGLLVSAKGLDDDANIEPRQTARHDLHERANDRRLMGTVVGIAGGVALVTGIIKLAMHPRDRERKVTTSLNLGVSRGSLVVMGRF